MMGRVAGAQEAGRRYAGAASALSGGSPFLAGSLTAPLTGCLGTQTLLTMATGMGAFIGTAALLAGIRRLAARSSD
jgi:DHA1 family bicyclomycin/chloramphenicol resistance-like MFS transporter